MSENTGTDYPQDEEPTDPDADPGNLNPRDDRGADSGDDVDPDADPDNLNPRSG